MESGDVKPKGSIGEAPSVAPPHGDTTAPALEKPPAIPLDGAAPAVLAHTDDPIPRKRAADAAARKARTRDTYH